MKQAHEKPRTHQNIFVQPLALEPLGKLPRWVLWNWQAVPVAGSCEVRWTKVPYQVRNPRHHARTDDPATWGGYNSAVDAVKRGEADGIGFVLTDSGYGAVDIDHCLDKKGNVAAWAQELQEILDKHPNFYCETTVSGTGLRLIGTSDAMEKIHRRFSVGENGAGIELFNCKAERYVTVSGLEFSPCVELPPIDGLLADLLKRCEAQPKPASAKPKHAKTGMGGSAEPSGGAGAAPNGFDFNTARETKDYDAVIREGVPVGDRSEEFQRAVWSLAAKIDPKNERPTETLAAIIAELEANPDGIAAKYKGRVAREAERSFNKWRDERKREEELNAVDRTKTDGAWNKPAIRVIPGIIDKTASEAERALIDAGAPLYTRGGQIVRPVVEEVQATRGFKTKVARARPATADCLVDYMARSARFERYDARAKKFVSIDPPKSVAAIILSRDGEWWFPAIAGLLTTPTLRPDGTILSEPGYDEETHLLLLAPPGLPPIPDAPTRADAERAHAVLNELLEEFCFADAESRAVAMSGLMTPVVRGAMTVAPIHAFAAPAAGSGKSYLTDLCSAIATGQRSAGIAAGRDEAETEKRLVGAAMTADQIISIDNLNGDLGGDFLCQLAERPLCTVRILGGNSADHMHRIENRSTVFANGNNITPRGDVVRRTLLGMIDTNLERPYERSFKKNPLRMILADRSKYIAAILTVVRAYLAAGEPVGLTPLGSYEDWSRMVRNPLVWMGEADPVKTIDTSRDDDPELITLTTVMTELRKAVGEEYLTAGQIKQTAEERDAEYSTFNFGPHHYRHPELHQALVDAAGIRGEVDSRRLGHYLSRFKGRIVGSMKLSANKDLHNKQQAWAVVGPRDGNKM